MLDGGRKGHGKLSMWHFKRWWLSIRKDNNGSTNLLKPVVNGNWYLEGILYMWIPLIEKRKEIMPIIYVGVMSLLLLS